MIGAGWTCVGDATESAIVGNEQVIAGPIGALFSAGGTAGLDLAAAVAYVLKFGEVEAQGEGLLVTPVTRFPKLSIYTRVGKVMGIASLASLIGGFFTPNIQSSAC